MLETTIDHGTTIKDLIVHFWNSKTAQTSQVWDILAPANLYREIVPGGNKVIYVLGHLLAIQDRTIEGMRLGERLFPELDPVFLTPQTADHPFPDPVVLRKQWDKVNEVLQHGIDQLTIKDWLGPHFYVSAQEFIDKPHRNILNLLLARAGHIANHLGQLALVKAAISKSPIELTNGKSSI